MSSSGLAGFVTELRNAAVVIQRCCDKAPYRQLLIAPATVDFAVCTLETRCTLSLSNIPLKF